MGTSSLLERPESGAMLTGGVVCWQHPVSRRYVAVGVLSYGSRGYAFSYLPDAREIDGFHGLLGFSDFEQVYRSLTMFPIFAQRVMDSGRSDRPALLDALGLTAEVTPMEFLVRSGGHRGGDTIELLPLPTIEDDATACEFFVHGVRHQAGAEARLRQLRSGDRLELVAEPDNAYDHRAILVTDDGTSLGWVPGPLLDYVHHVLACGEPSLSVVRVNGPEVGHHLRLLVRLEGRVPPGYQPLWEDVALRHQRRA